MIVVRIELHSARTGEVSEIGRMVIVNNGTSTNVKRGNYTAHVRRRGNSWRDARTGRVENFPRLSYNVWRLVLRALRACFPEEHV